MDKERDFVGEAANLLASVHRSPFTAISLAVDGELASSLTRSFAHSLTYLLTHTLSLSIPFWSSLGLWPQSFWLFDTEENDQIRVRFTARNRKGLRSVCFVCFFFLP